MKARRTLWLRRVQRVGTVEVGRPALALAVALVAASIGCRSAPDARQAGGVKAAAAPVDASALSNEETDSLLETVYRWQIVDLAARGAALEVYFPSGVNGVDPTDEFLARLADLHVKLRKPSQTEVDPRVGIRDRETHLHGAILRVREIRVQKDGTVEAHVESIAGDEGMEGATLILEKLGPYWVVRSVRDPWVT